MAQYIKKDPQNQYRTGVLIGNYCEDKFGEALGKKDVSIHILKESGERHADSKGFLVVLTTIFMINFLYCNRLSHFQTFYRSQS